MKTNIKLNAWLVCFGLFMLLIISCNDNLEDETFLTTDEMTIIGTLESNPEKFSMYVDILKKTEYYNSFNSYGSYTCFAPTNEAIEKFLNEEMNVNSVDDLSTEDQIEFLKIIVKFHTIATRRATSGFIEGRIPDTTYTGDFLTTSYIEGGGISNVLINREAKMDQYDIDANNGVIHALETVLNPYVDPVPKVMEDSGNYTIFIEALKQTGYYDTFSVIFNDAGFKNSFTILAESDEVYAQEGINSFDELVNFISPTDSDFMDPNNDLNRFMAYHATESFLYSSNFPSDGFISTVLPKNAIKSFKTDKELKINETETGVNDTWTSLIAAGSNFPAKNGVYHTVNKLLTIFTPKAKRIIFDFATGLKEFGDGTFRPSGWEANPDVFTSVRLFPFTRMRVLANAGDAFDGKTVLNLGPVTWIEWDTPVLPKGKYEVRVSGNQGNNNRPTFQCYWDGEPIGSQWVMSNNLSDTFGGGWADLDERALREGGYMRGLKEGEYQGESFSGGPVVSASSYDSNNFCRFIVTKELLCPEQQSHVFRLATIRSGGIPIDYVEFVPVD